MDTHSLKSYSTIKEIKQRIYQLQNEVDVSKECDQSLYLMERIIQTTPVKKLMKIRILWWPLRWRVLLLFRVYDKCYASPLQWLKSMVKWGQKIVEISTTLRYFQVEEMWKWNGSLYFIGKIVVILDRVKIIEYMF